MQKKHKKVWDLLYMIKMNRNLKNYQMAVLIYLIMELLILDNGKMAKDKEAGNNYGMMVHFMKVTGKKIWLMEKED